MRRINLSEIRNLYNGGANIIDYLKKHLGVTLNTDELVEISYDMQAGSYIKFVRDNLENMNRYRNEVAGLLDTCVMHGDTVLDVGTGEMTTLSTVVGAIHRKISCIYALDISLSRLLVGRDYLKSIEVNDVCEKVHPIVSTLFNLPFDDNSCDVVWTSHALEPNGGREREAINELVRVSRRHIVLFEPSYENNSATGRKRMDDLGYIKGIPAVLRENPNLVVESVVPIVSTISKLNPTYCYVIRKVVTGEINDPVLCCPLSKGKLERRNSYYFSKNSLLAYPSIELIPILRVEKGISASVLGLE